MFHEKWQTAAGIIAKVEHAVRTRRNLMHDVNMHLLLQLLQVAVRAKL